MELIGTVLNLYHISILKKHLDKAELKYIYHEIDEKCLVTLPDYQNTKGEKNKTQNQLYRNWI